MCTVLLRETLWKKHWRDDIKNSASSRDPLHRRVIQKRHNSNPPLLSDLYITTTAVPNLRFVQLPAEDLIPAAECAAGSIRVSLCRCLGRVDTAKVGGQKKK